jgi:TonB-linked SusC/RagA family outer membrane protein
MRKGITQTLLTVTPRYKAPGGPNIKQLIMSAKLTAFLLMAACLQLSARTVAQSVTLSEKKASIEKVFKQIGRQSGYQFMYTTDILQKAKPVDIEVKNMQLNEALNLVFKDQPLTYSIVEKVIVVKEKKESPVIKSGDIPVPPPTVKGRITNEKGEPVVGVNISLKGGKIIGVTNDNGEFVLNNIPDNAVIVFSAVTIEDFETKLNGRSELALNAKTKVSKLEDVEITVNTGYQSLSKERVTGSVATIDNKLFNRATSGTVLNRLEGITPGMLFNRNVSAASNPNGVDISIRGVSTLVSNNQPLIIVDNFPYSGNIANINPNDVENVTILKDAAAASIWGAFAGNGVIVITTKKGKMNQQPVVEFNSNLTIGNRPDLYYNRNFLNSNDFIDLEIQMFRSGYYNTDLTSGVRPVISPVVALLDRYKRGLTDSATAYGKINAFRNIDARNDLSKYLLRPSFNQQYSMSVRGGGSRNDYLLSVGLDDALSSYVGNKDQRFTLNSAQTFYPSSKIEVAAVFNYIQSVSQNNSIFSSVTPGSGKTLYPYAQLADAAGNPLEISKDLNSGYKDTLGGGKLADWRYFPLRDKDMYAFGSKTFDTRLNLAIKYKPTNNLALEVRYQYERSSTQGSNYYRDSSYYVRNLYDQFANLSTGARPIPLGGILYSNNQSVVAQNARAQLSYNWNSNPRHNVSVIAGAEVSQSVAEGNSNTAYGYDDATKSSQLVDFLNFYSTNPSGTVKILNNFGFSKTTDRFISYFVSGNYTFDKKYSLLVSARTDKSNLFGVNTNQKSVPLYSLGGKWDLSKESFYHIPWLVQNSLRVSFGYNGNVNKRVTAVPTLRTLSNSAYSGVPYAVIANSGNPDLRWEKVSIFNIGWDFALRNNTLSGSIEYFTKKGIDLIGDSPLPPSVGISLFTGNAANTSGHGLEINLTSNNLKGALKWQTNFMLSYVKDIVTDYKVTSTSTNYIRSGMNNGGVGSQIYPLEGKPLYAMYSYKWAGLDPSNGNPRGYIGTTPSTDYNTIFSNTTVDSMQFQGTSRPTTFGSLRNTFSYKNFSVSFNIVYKLNYFFRRSSVDYQSLISSWNGNADYTNRWQKPGDETRTDVPSIQFPPFNSNREIFYAFSSALIEKGDHIRLQDISLSYDFPKPAGGRIRNLQVYSYINNVGILWRANRKNLDPDLYNNSLPMPLIISFGVRANF